MSTAVRAMAEEAEQDEGSLRERGPPTPAHDESVLEAPDAPDAFESPVERKLALDKLNAKLFGAGERSSEPEVAPTIGRFSVLRKLGQGGMGMVYLGYDEDLGRQAAIKVLRGDSGAVQRREQMQREAKALARLNHPNVVQIYEIGEFWGYLFGITGCFLKRGSAPPRCLRLLNRPEGEDHAGWVEGSRAQRSLPRSLLERGACTAQWS